VHFEWTHSNWSVRLKGNTEPYSPKHVKVDFTEFEYGFQYKRIRQDTSDEDKLWTIGRVCLWPNALFTGDHCEFRVPIDDETTLSITLHFARVPREREPYVQGRIPTWQGPISDPATGRWITSHVMNQDFVAWVGQGKIADRSKELLAPSDRGVVMARRRFLSDLDALDKGVDPKAIVRDPKINDPIVLPVADRTALIEGKTRAEYLKDPLARRALQGYVFQAGQPAEVRDEFLAAMGFNGAEINEMSSRPAPSRA
jgi:5,5'-dehydrodivanillate O-demethylase